MKIFFFLLAISFIILFVANLAWFITTIYFWATEGITFFYSFLNPEEGLLENIYYSTYVRWLVLADVFWFISLATFMLQRKHFKTDPNQHYLAHNPIKDPKICVVIPAYNEQQSIEKVVKDFLGQKYVESVIILDNKSTDNTVALAEKCGAKVIKQDRNRGFAHNYATGLKEALKTDANIIATADADGTSNAYDLEKMIPYLDNSDMVVGSRQVQILTQKGNQNSMLHVWGNFLLAKLIQFKYFSLHHFGIVILTDVGCLYRLIRYEALEKLSDNLFEPKTGDVVGGIAFLLYLTMKGIEKDLKIVEVPLTFNKRIGQSKTQSNKKFTGIKYGLIFLKYILLH